MNLSDYYFYFKKQINEKKCNDIISASKKKLVKAQVYANDDELVNNFLKKDTKNNKKTSLNEKERTSKVCFISHQWIYEILHPLIHEANKKANWNFEFSYTEPLQFTQYGLNEFYNWHQDCPTYPFKDTHPNFNGKIRKISSITNLSKPGDYEGGDVEFDFRNLRKKSSNVRVCEEIKEQGSVVVFPSFIFHRVTPVTKGTRYSLVSWTLGNPWK
jgi:PKHD-type hydroxylase